MASEPLTRDAVEAIIRRWPPTPREAATTVMSKYGPPQEATPSMLRWSGTGPWKWTMLWREEAPHRFPQPHVDVLEQAIDYRVPPDKASELAAFDGSMIVERTKGELSARCEGEEANFLAINLAHQIVTGRMGVEQAPALHRGDAGLLPGSAPSRYGGAAVRAANRRHGRPRRGHRRRDDAAQAGREVRPYRRNRPVRPIESSDPPRRPAAVRPPAG